MAEKIKLKDWQEAVVNCIKNHEELISGDDFTSLPQFEINQKTHIKVKFPSRYGHTWLAAYLSAAYDSVIIYNDADHLKEIQNYWQYDFKDICTGKNRKAISVYEIFYAAHYENMVQKPIKQIVTLQQIKSKVQDKKIIIVDHASDLPSVVEGWIMQVAENAIVLLD